MRALPAVEATALSVCVAPEFLQLAVMELVGDHDHHVVGAAIHYDAGRLPVEVGDTHQVPRGDVVGREEVAGGPVHPRKLLAGHAVKDRQPLRALSDATIRVTGIAFGSGLRDDLRPPVTIQIMHQVGRVPHTALNAPAEVLPPEEGAVGEVGLELVGVGACVPVELVGVHVLVRLLNDEVVAAIAVEVADADLLAAIVALQRDGQVKPGLLGRGRRCLVRRPTFGASGDCAHNVVVLRARYRALIHEVASVGDRLFGQPLRLLALHPPVDVEAYILRIIGQQPPADVDAVAIHRRRHEAAVHSVNHAFCRPALHERLRRTGLCRQPTVNDRNVVNHCLHHS